MRSHVREHASLRRSFPAMAGRRGGVQAGKCHPWARPVRARLLQICQVVQAGGRGCWTRRGGGGVHRAPGRPHAPTASPGSLCASRRACHRQQGGKHEPMVCRGHRGGEGVSWRVLGSKVPAGRCLDREPRPGRCLQQGSVGHGWDGADARDQRRSAGMWGDGQARAKHRGGNVFLHSTRV